MSIKRISERRLERLTKDGHLEQTTDIGKVHKLVDIRWTVSGNCETFRVEPACETDGCEALPQEMCKLCEGCHTTAWRKFIEGDG